MFTPQEPSSTTKDDYMPDIMFTTDNVPTLARCGYPASFLLRLCQSAEQASSKDTIGTLTLITIDNFAMIVSGFGHEISEKILFQLEEALANITSENTTVQRIQRDQYAIVTMHDSIQYHEEQSQKISQTLREFSGSSGYGELHLMASLTHITFPEEAETAEEIMELAYIRIHESQSLPSVHTPSGKEVLHNKELDLHTMSVARYLNDAIRENRLCFAYQAIICSKTGAITHHEALLRLRNHDGEVSSAGPLIPVAERMGIIDLIDISTLKMTVNELRTYPDITLAFNVSNLTTNNDAWLKLFHEMIEETPEIAERMMVEITETAAQRDFSRTAYFVASIQSTGARVALDDFGSGYTSFRQLKSLSVDMIKIDGAFIKDLIDNADNRFFVKTLLDFTHGFGLQSVAEYVENGEIAKMLMELGVEYMQGFYFSQPDTNPEWHVE